jgi:Zn-dependent protease with chaperone function
VGSLTSPLLAVTALVALATSLHRRLPPRLATRFVTVALVIVVMAAVPTALLIAVAFLTHVPLLGIGFEWCAQAIGLHSSVSASLGIPAVAVLTAGGVRTVRLVREHRSLRCDVSHPIRRGSIHVAHSQRPFAVTLPGGAGQIVISSALLEILDEDERRVVVAHERAHARYRHDRYLLAAELAAAAVPPLRALARRASYSIERWADEAAAAACGDRQLVARTLGKVALHSNTPTVAGFAGLGVASRMGALLAPPLPNPPRAQVVVLWSSLAVAAAFGAYQLHHLEQLLAALCPH